MSEQEAYLEQYTSELQPLLLQLAQQEGFLRGPLLETADLDELWPALAQPYMASAVPDFEQYPLVSLGWMTFVGMAMAVLWDEDWQRYQPLGSALYTQLRDARGWDELDEYVLEDVLGMLRGSEEAKRYTDWCVAWQSWRLRSFVMRMPSHRVPWHSSSMHVRSSVSIASE